MTKECAKQVTVNSTPTAQVARSAKATPVPLVQMTANVEQPGFANKVFVFLEPVANEATVKKGCSAANTDASSVRRTANAPQVSCACAVSVLWQIAEARETAREARSVKTTPVPLVQLIESVTQASFV